ncbi:SipW-dependent-type signal peptide-containing protein [Candidatus Saccharibacteria bacterium]|nr:SipW-dependent-type signal peptide-containing protein [Candidatus Saccharibacteria bacterium]
MFQKVRITIGSIAVIALCLLSSTFTLSYFTDTVDSVNSFKIGNAASTLSIFKDDTGETLFDASEYTLTPNMDDIPFYLEATNTGNIPVYQRFRIVIPTALADYITLNLPTTTDNYTVTTPQPGTYYIVSNNVLPVDGKTERWPTLSIRVGDISEVDPSAYICQETSANDCVLGINVHSDVIQTTGFENADDAFANLDNNN